MDEFGVLVESIGFKPQGKSAPMAKLKPQPKPKPKPNSHFTPNTTSFHDLPIDNLDGIFRSDVNINRQSYGHNNDDDDIFGVKSVSNSGHFGGIDLESVLGNGKSDKFGGYDGDDLLGLNSGTSDDLFGGFKGSGDGKVGFDDDLIPGFGGGGCGGGAENGVNSKTDRSPGSNGHPSNSKPVVDDDPFSVFETAPSQSNVSWSFPAPSGDNTKKDPVQSSIDELDDFVKGRSHNGSRNDRMRTAKPSAGAASKGFETVDDLDALITGGVKQKHAAKPSNNQDAGFDILFHEEKPAQTQTQTTSRSSLSTKKASAATNITDDFGSLFGDFTSPSGEFQEFEGEPAERRKARLNRHMRTNARMAEALAEKNQRDFQSQQEQEEKRRLAETLDYDVKRWAAGKEGNLRALLSSLQQVLWPECGWRPVSLTDMITSDSVKKVYKRATLSVHPDKVQQKGATIQQKYIAEKVFDLLKEAWNKFSAEELR